MLVQEGLTVEDAMAATAKREAAALARIREVHPGYDPWRPVPTAAEMQARAAAAAATATGTATGTTAAPEAPAASAAEARATLRVAHAAHVTALADREAAVAVADHARAACDAADATVHRYDDLDARIVSDRVAALRAGDGTAPPPPALAAEQRQRGAAIDAADAAHKALDVVLAEARAAEHTADAATAALSAAAASLVLAHAERIADGFAAIEAEALARRSALVALAGVWFPPGSGRPGPVPLSPRLRRLLADPPPNAAAVLNSLAPGDPAAQAPWLALHAALVADPAADADDPDDADPTEAAAAPPG